MFCTRCGQRNPANARYCCACGTAMRLSATPTVSSPISMMLVEWPARIIGGYFALLRGFYLLVVIILWPLTLAALVLWFGFGIRWGW